MLLSLKLIVFLWEDITAREFINWVNEGLVTVFKTFCYFGFLVLFPIDLVISFRNIFHQVGIIQTLFPVFIGLTVLFRLKGLRITIIDQKTAILPIFLMIIFADLHFFNQLLVLDKFLLHPHVYVFFIFFLAKVENLFIIF